jgi:hypothetical protein
VKGSAGDAAEAALKTIGDGNVPGEFVRGGGPIGVQAGVGVVEFEFPGAVEGEPAGALELGLGIFGRGTATAWRAENARKMAAILCKLDEQSQFCITILYCSRLRPALAGVG